MTRAPAAVLVLFNITSCHGAAVSGVSGTDAPAAATASVSASVTASATVTASAPAPVTATATRPYKLVLPDHPDGGAMPLVILLHGYGSNGLGHDAYFQLSSVTKARGVALAIPNGTPDHTGKLFWNATDACCDFDDNPVDDVATLDSIIDDASSKAPVDRARVYIIGHSNGAFMAHRYACDRSDRVAAIVALAGVPPEEESACQGKRVSVLQVHGDADRIIAYPGGHSFGNGKPYPSAEDSVAAWAKRDGCSGGRHASGPPLDFDLDVPGPETTRESYDCPSGLEVSLWRMHGSGHVPRFDKRFANAAIEFLLAHVKR